MEISKLDESVEAHVTGLRDAAQALLDLADSVSQPDRSDLIDLRVEAEHGVTTEVS